MTLRLPLYAKFALCMEKITITLYFLLPRNYFIYLLDVVTFELRYIWLRSN